MRFRTSYQTTFSNQQRIYNPLRNRQRIELTAEEKNKNQPLAFGSQAEKEKLFNTAIQSRLGEPDLYLNLSKREGPLRNGRSLSPLL